MKKLLSSPKFLFTLLAVASMIAVVAGVYLGFVLGTPMPGTTRILPFLGMVFWAEAWIEFLTMCMHLGKGKSAFTASTGRTLRVIGWCMAGLAVVTVLASLMDGVNPPAALFIIETVLLPGFFLAVAVAAKILRDLLVRAMAIEKEQEGVV